MVFLGVASTTCFPSSASFFSVDPLQEVSHAAKRITTQKEKLVNDDFMVNRLTFELLK